MTKKILLFIILILVLLSIFLFSFKLNPVSPVLENRKKLSTYNSIALKEKKNNIVKTTTFSTPEELTKISLTAVGDIMMHMPQVYSAKATDDTYDFTPMFEYVKGYLSESDITIGNLETTLSGKALGYSGYPGFNTPEQLAYDLKKIGFDIVVTANNHCMDKSIYGIEKTIENLDKSGLKHTGTFKNEDTSPLIYEVKNTKIAFLSYTSSINGISIPKGKEFSVNLIDKNKILFDIKTAKSSGAEFCIFYSHFGTEYERNPSKQQKEFVQFLFENGIDIVLGSHPHVIQPMKFKEIITKDGKKKKCFVIYSMGNFISNQPYKYTDSGVIMKINLLKKNNELTIDNVDYITTWVYKKNHKNKVNYRVLPVNNVINKKIFLSDLDDKDLLKIKSIKKETSQHIEKYKK